MEVVSFVTSIKICLILLISQVVNLSTSIIILLYWWVSFWISVPWYFCLNLLRRRVGNLGSSIIFFNFIEKSDCELWSFNYFRFYWWNGVVNPSLWIVFFHSINIVGILSLDLFNFIKRYEVVSLNPSTFFLFYWRVGMWIFSLQLLLGFTTHSSIKI